jgi:hypothetical protein
MRIAIRFNTAAAGIQKEKEKEKSKKKEENPEVKEMSEQKGERD